MAAVAIKKPDQAELLHQLAEAVNLEQRGQEAQKIHAQITASIWTAEDRERGRQMGREVVAMKAQEARTLWAKEAVRLIVDGYDDGKYIFRDSIIEGLRSYCFAYQIEGKGGGTIQRETISRWFTKEREEAVRIAAMTRLIERAKA